MFANDFIDFAQCGVIRGTRRGPRRERSRECRARACGAYNVNVNESKLPRAYRYYSSSWYDLDCRVQHAVIINLEMYYNSNSDQCPV